tara:strand:- start:655 stop:960 length:306 start_codon:yes stop_codon:yes gene_type:complete
MPQHQQAQAQALLLQRISDAFDSGDNTVYKSMWYNVTWGVSQAKDGSYGLLWHNHLAEQHFTFSSKESILEYVSRMTSVLNPQENIQRQQVLYAFGLSNSK